MVSVLTSSVVDPRFELRLDQAENYEIGICCFFAKRAVIMRFLRAKTGWQGIGIMCPSRATCLTTTVVSVS